MSDDGFERSIILRLLVDIDLSEGDSGRAMKRYQVALIFNKEDFRIYNGMGEAYFAMDNLEQALQPFERALELYQYSVDLLNNVGVVFDNIGKTDEASNCFKKALSLMPTHSDARENMEQIHQ